MSRMNRLANTKNQFQGKFKKVLCVCSAGLLRSPTAALVLSQEPFNFNTRAAGISSDYALVIVDEILIEWADEIVCMNSSQESILKEMMNSENKTPIIVLDIPDNFIYRDPELMRLIFKNYAEKTITKKDNE